MRSAVTLAGLGAILIFSDAGAQGGRGGRGTPIKSGEQCPPGMTEVRPNMCQAPELAAPSIVDYRPRSTLVVPVHMVPKAKFPVIDFHGHPAGALGSPERIAALGASLDSINVRMMIVADNVSGDELKRSIAAVAAFSGISGASAGSTLPASLESPPAFSPVTFSGDYRWHDHGWRKAHYR